MNKHYTCVFECQTNTMLLKILDYNIIVENLSPCRSKIIHNLVNLCTVPLQRNTR